MDLTRLTRYNLLIAWVSTAMVIANVAMFLVVATEPLLSYASVSMLALVPLLDVLVFLNRKRFREELKEALG